MNATAMQLKLGRYKSHMKSHILRCLARNSKTSAMRAVQTRATQLAEWTLYRFLLSLTGVEPARDHKWKDFAGELDLQSRQRGAAATYMVRTKLNFEIHT